jgi:AcrR family transcriptional regulator
MGRKLGLTRDDVIVAAATVADRDGIEALSLASVAAELRVRSPSLYHHVAGLDGLRRAIALHGAERLRVTMRKAADGLRGKRALMAAADAYRAFARRHPGQLAAMLPAPRPNDDPELYRALAGPVADLAVILADLRIEGDDAIHAIRALRAFLHGFIDLERRGGFGMPQAIDVSFDRGLRAFIDGITPSR